MEGIVGDGDPREEWLLIRLEHDGLTDIFPTDVLVIETADPQQPALLVDVVGWLGCSGPPGMIDCDGDPANGCEYACVPTGPETCDGVDNDCNCVVDEGC